MFRDSWSTADRILDTWWKYFGFGAVLVYISSRYLGQWMNWHSTWVLVSNIDWEWKVTEGLGLPLLFCPLLPMVMISLSSEDTSTTHWSPRWLSFTIFVMYPQRWACDVTWFDLAVGWKLKGLYDSSNTIHLQWEELSLKYQRTSWLCGCHFPHSGWSWRLV